MNKQFKAILLTVAVVLIASGYVWVVTTYPLLSAHVFMVFEMIVVLYLIYRLILMNLD